MENPLGLFRSQIYRLFKTKGKATVPDAEPSFDDLKRQFPWANDRELGIIKKERLYLDADFRND